MQIKYFLLFFIIFSTRLFAAGPLMHLWVAQRFCEICDISDKEVLQEIIMGAEFPEIHNITKIMNYV